LSEFINNNTAFYNILIINIIKPCPIQYTTEPY